MKVIDFRTLPGPNVYSHEPMLVMRLDLEELTEKESYEIPGFIDRLLDLLPGLRNHHCSKGRPGGFVERLREGTYFGHTVEHAALELTVLADIATVHGKTRMAVAPNIYSVVIEYKAEQATRRLLSTAVELVDALVRGESFPLEERIKEAKALAAETEMGPSTRSIVEAAARRGIPWMRLNGESLVQLGYGKNRRLIQAAMTDRTSVVAVEVASDKDLTKSLLERASIPVPRGVIVRTADEALAALEEIGPPVVVKPLDGRQGKGVSLNLTTYDEVISAFQAAIEFSRNILVEELFEGNNYRVLVVNGKLVAASERVPCHVVGDGKHNVAELIELENKNPLRGEGHEKPLTQIKLDPILQAFMRKEGLSLQDVPEAGARVMLCAGMNLSTGGTAKDVTDEVHPSIRRLSERAARAVGLDICGIDIVTKDISKPLGGRGEGVIEANAAPGLRMHLFPNEGEPRDVGAAIVAGLYPEGSPARIPIISTTGTNGKTTVTRMIGHALAEAGLKVGMTTTDGIWLDGELITEGDTTGPISARTVLSDSSVEVAVLETARGGIVRRGLGYDWSDISVMTNVRPDHIGQDGIEDVEDLLHIKSLVAERVKEGGTLILNADDERLVRLTGLERINRVPKRIIYFSLDAENPVVKNHTAAGHTAYFVRGGSIVEAAGGGETEMVRAADLSVTMQGTAEYQIANVLAAVAACRAYGLPEDAVMASMKSFSNATHNPGRGNLFRVGGGYVLVDYGHNPDAFDAVARTAALWNGRRVTAIVGVPGDRNDDLIVESGRAAARGFHRVIIKEDKDLRGRQKGEVAGLLCRAVNEQAPDLECRVVADEVEALDSELQRVQEGEIIVIFHDKIRPILATLEKHGASAVSAIEGLQQSSLAGAAYGHAGDPQRPPSRS
ncbi:MAG TPA: cyanophycin synthetase [Blastocatellia bacterium]|jgi:cyanophycin synthetase|nr:cyanophycin synthetase [Blastocatellia bacterium]